MTTEAEVEAEMEREAAATMELLARADRLLDGFAFQDWLAGQDGRQAVGVQGMPDRCPLALYLERQDGVVLARVKTTEARITFRTDTPTGSETVFRRLPAWAKRFVAAVDSSGNRVIRAGLARRIMAEVGPKRH